MCRVLGDLMRTMPVLSVCGAAWVAERGLYREREGCQTPPPVCVSLPQPGNTHPDGAGAEVAALARGMRAHLQDGTSLQPLPRVLCKVCWGAGPGPGPSQPSWSPGIQPSSSSSLRRGSVWALLEGVSFQTPAAPAEMSLTGKCPQS